MKQQEAFLGIDVSKGYADFMFLDGQKQPIEKPFQLDDNFEGHRQLEALLKLVQQQHGIGMFYCGLESTGGFENNWYAMLQRAAKTFPLKVSRLNPAGVKANIEAGLNRNITDALSSRYIAEYLIAHPDKVNFNQGSSSIYNACRSLHRHIQLLTKQQTQLVNQLLQLLYSNFPELLIYCRHGIPQWLLTLLVKYPTRERIGKQNEKRLTQIKFITPEKARALLDKARQSVAADAEPVMEELIKSLAQQIIGKQAVIATHKKQLTTVCKGTEVDLLDSIPGFGCYIAAVMMIEIENINRFPTAKQLTSYFGIHPELKQSGDKAAFRMSKKGRSAPRAMLYLAGLSAVRHDEHIKAIYHRQRKLGKSHNQAMGAVMSKLLRMVFGILKSNKSFDAATDQANISKNAASKQPETKQQEEIKNKRRYQQLSSQAPVSNKQSKKRKVHLQSQTEQVGEVRDQVNAPS